MNLDDPMQIADRDPTGVVYGISTLPDACAEASVLGAATGVEIGKPDSIVVISDPPIYAQIVAAIALAASDIPVNTYPNTGKLGDITLLIAIDVTGRSRTVDDAIAAVSSLNATALVIRSGANVSEPSGNADQPRTITIPGGQHGAIAAICAAIAVIAESGSAPGLGRDISETVAVMRRQARAYAVPSLYENNPAKRLAQLLAGRLPYLLGSTNRDLIGSYWRDRISGYAKVMSIADEYTDSDFEGLAWRNAIRQCNLWSIVALRQRTNDAGRTQRFDEMLDTIDEDIPLHEVFADGGSLAEQILCAMYYGEFVAGYMALMWNEDPAAE